MRVDLAYGRHGTSVEVPDDAAVILPREQPAVADQESAVRADVAPRLAGLVNGGTRVAVGLPDLTPPLPNRPVLPPLLAELGARGVPDRHITLLCATGTHRQATPDEME